MSEDESESDACSHQAATMPLKSGKVHTVDAMVLRNVTWLFELVAGQPAVYEDLSVTLFVSGYFVVMDTSKQALKPIMVKYLKELRMADGEVYGWALVRAYNTVWL